MKRLLLATMLSLAAFTASAQSATVDARANVSASAIDSVDAQAKVQTQAQAGAKPTATERRNDPNCVTQTGTHLKSRQRNGCVANGRSYSRDDLDRTGQTDVGEALRRLDPRLH